MTDTVPRVLALVPRDSDGCVLWRHRWPMAELTQNGYIAHWQYFENYKQEIEPKIKSGIYNVVVTPRFVWRESWMAERFSYILKKHEVAWAYELDDDMLSPEIVNRQVAFAMSVPSPDSIKGDEHEARVRAQSDYERVERIRLLSMIDGATVSTESLEKVARKHTDAPIYTVPNAMNIPWFNNRLSLTTLVVPPLTIGWSGGWRMESDVHILSEAWPVIANEFPDVHFVLHGWAVPSIVRAMPAGRLTVLPWCDINNYPSSLANIDIGCCSVDKSEWNERKSCIKWYEFSMAGSACVGSHALYGQEIRDGYDGFLATTKDEWITQLRKLVSNPSLKKEISTNAQETVVKYHNIARSWQQWRDAWSGILERSARNRADGHVLGGVPV